MLKFSKFSSLIFLRNSIKYNNDAYRIIQRSFRTSQPIHSSTDSKKFTTFEDVTNKRRDEAQKSLLVQVNSEKSYSELFNYCSQFGTIKAAYHYDLSEGFNFILLEFSQYSEYLEAVNSCSFSESTSPSIPVVSPFVWFRANDSKLKVPKSTQKPQNLIHQDIKSIEEAALLEILASAESLSDQILILYRLTSLNELGIRLRYLAGRQLEMALSGMFPKIQSCLFGSSVNGFGKMGCDLDLILRLNELSPPLTPSRLVYHTKKSLLNSRSQVQRQMEAIGDIMHIFLPAVNNIRKILNARVPIIKYNHECLDLDIDFSMSNMTGFYMSELLYLYGEMDERVRPLVFCIRKWASSTGLTNPATPGRWITNFGLTLMVLFYLQNLKILPSMSQLIKSASPADIRVTEDNINCTFLRDLNQLTFSSSNDESLHHLLVHFFEFYSTFDFHVSGISLVDGRPIVKPDHSAIWITNPLEPMLNVSKNVSHEELEKLRIETRNAAWTLEGTIEKNREPSWGLMSLFRSKKKAPVKAEMFFKSRLVEVQDLFGEDQGKIEYKNAAVKAAVKDIQKTTKREISKLLKNS